MFFKITNPNPWPVTLTSVQQFGPDVIKIADNTAITAPLTQAVHWGGSVLIAGNGTSATIAAPIHTGNMPDLMQNADLSVDVTIAGVPAS